MIDIWVDAVGRLRRSLPLWPHPEPKGRCTWEVWHCYSVRTSVLYYLKISRYPPLTPNQEILVHDNSHSVSFFILMSLKCTSSSLHDPKEKWGKRFAYSHEGKHNISRGVKMGAKGLGAPTVQGKRPFFVPRQWIDAYPIRSEDFGPLTLPLLIRELYFPSCVQTSDRPNLKFIPPHGSDPTIYPTPQSTCEWHTKFQRYGAISDIAAI